MFCVLRPTPAKITAFLNGLEAAPFSYPEVGSTRADPPANYNVDRHEARLGTGQMAFESACQALCEWKMFDLPWLQVVSPDLPIAPGTTVAVVARAHGLWAVGACRIVYVIEEARRFGFAYGTLAHVDRGEEQFVVEWRDDDSVWYRVLAFSRPGHWLTWVGYPYARYCQRRFRVESAARMQKELAGS